MNKSITLVIGSITVSVLLMKGMTMGQRPEPKETIVKGDTVYKVLEPGMIPAIFKPEYISPAPADKYYYPDEPLIVVADGEAVKGYSTWHLDRHEVVNDYINGNAITVTW